MRRNRPRWDPDWECPLCNVTIFGRHDACKKCKTPKVKPGDWVCRRAECSGAAFNFASRVECRACQQPKPEACLCSAPRFRGMKINGSLEPSLGDCKACLRPNPTPWDEAYLARLESTTNVPQEYRCYRLEGAGGAPTHNRTGLGEKVPYTANAWLFHTRDDVAAELKENREGFPASVKIVDKRI